MKRLLTLLILAALVYGGYRYYQNKQGVGIAAALPIPPQGQLVMTAASDNLGNLAAVLGAKTQNILSGGKEFLSSATDGQSDPIINRAVENLQSQVKDLPKETVDKVKYEFCRGVVSEYEQAQK